MKIEFRKAVLPADLRALLAFDSKVFPAPDRFPADYWREIESWWMLVGRARAGCCAFEKRGKTLYLSTTGLLPRFQGRGLGAVMKAWELAYARYHGYRRVTTHCRKSNTRMIALNRQFGFKIRRTVRGYYTHPDDDAVLMELIL